MCIGRCKAVLVGLLLLMLTQPAWSQPVGWSTALPIAVTENSGATLTGYQLQLTLDTQSLVSAGKMNADGSDLRFGADEAGTTLFPYWIESGINTAATVVWVRIDTLPASSARIIWMFTGNPGASDAGSLTSTFNFIDLYNNSATNQVFGGSPGGVGNSQRGFRFSPNEDILVFAFGKCEPTGTTRYVTLFDNSTQAILAQTQVPGPACGAFDQYQYSSLPQPVWLTQGTQYLLELYQNAVDGYYFGNSSQINAKLTYYDMRYCNSCSQNTFPTNSLSNYHYGYPDFEFATKQLVSPAPTYAIGPFATTTVLASDCMLDFTGGQPFTMNAAVGGGFFLTGDVTFMRDGNTVCANVPLVGGVASCTVVVPYANGNNTNSHTFTAAYSGDAANASSTSNGLSTRVLNPPGVVFRGNFEDIPADCPVQ